MSTRRNPNSQTTEKEREREMGVGTEAFEDLGRHCEQEDCHQLDFLPFKCDACLKVFCLEHRTCEAHACPKVGHRSRVVVVCDACSVAIEKQSGGGGESDADALRRHARSGGCDPAAKKRKPRCPVKGCREQLTFSNTSTCGSCHQKMCLKHRFQDAHTCNPATAAAARDKFFLAFEGRMTGGNCWEKKPQRKPSPPPIEAC